MLKKFYQYIPLLILLAILIIGAYLRLHDISRYMTFLGDEGRDVLIVKRMIVDKKWTLLGPTASVGGFFMGPIYYYFMIPFLWAWRLDPVGPAFMVALFGITTIYLVYHMGKAMFNEHIGLIASGLYAVSPVVISYSRSSWNPNIVPFFSTLLIYLLWRLTLKKRMSDFYSIGIVLGIGIQLHYSFLFLFAVVLLWMLFYIRGVRHIRGYFLTLCGFLLGFSPFLAFELRHEFTNTRAIIAFVFWGKDAGFSPGHFITNISDVFLRIFGRFLFRYPDILMIGNYPVWVQRFWKVWSIFVGFFTVSVLAGMLVRPKIFSRFLKECTYSSRLLMLWIIIVLIFFGMYKKPVYDYYFGVFFALPFLLIAITLDALKYIRGGKLFFIISLLLLFYWNWQGRPFRFVPNNQLGQTRFIAQEVFNKTEGKPFNFALITGGNSDHAYRYFFEIWKQSPIAIQNPHADPERKTVADQLLVVCEDPSCQPLGNSLWEVAGFGRAEIIGTWDVSVVRVYKLVHFVQ